MERKCGKEPIWRLAFTVKNTGDKVGDEVVQLYFRDRFASRIRPVKELAGFARVSLQPGESKRVCFTLKESQMAFLDDAMSWTVERGEVELMIGASSEDIRLSETVILPESYIVEGRTRGFYAETYIE